MAAIFVSRSYCIVLYWGHDHLNNCL